MSGDDGLVYESEFSAAKRNLKRQGTKVLHDIISAYETGIFDDPGSSQFEFACHKIMPQLAGNPESHCPPRGAAPTEA